MVLNSKLRSWLTILGIVIGVASVIAIVSVGDGMEASMEDRLGDLGANSITISPGYSKASSFRGPMHKDAGSGTSNSDAILGRNDVIALKSIPEIEYVDTTIRGSVDVSFRGKGASVSLTGVDQKVWKDVTTEDIESGRLLEVADNNVIVIGNKLANDYFDDIVSVNNMLTIEGKAFRVVGILEDGGSSIYMPINSAYQLVDDSVRDEYDSLTVIFDPDIEADYMVEKIEKKLNVVRHVFNDDDKDFTVTSMASIQETISETLGVMTMFLTVIAAISLVVGAVGIANTMFTSVLEKTKEIGIMKAIGARNNDVLLIFLFNSGIIGLIGGLLGVVVGVGFSSILSGMLKMGPGGKIQTIVDPFMVLLALGIALVVGMVAGFIPAWQGSKLKPVDALRYE